MRTPLFSLLLLAFFNVGWSSAMTAQAGVVVWGVDSGGVGVEAWSGVQSGQTPQGGGGTSVVQTVDLGDVTGTVCDCGEIPLEEEDAYGLPKSKFAKYSLVAGAALPTILCIFGNDICEEEEPSKKNPEDVKRDVVPEPATIIALATGLGALALSRRRRREPDRH